MYTVAIVGPGRVGGAFAYSLPKNKYQVIELVSKDTDATRSRFADAVPEAKILPNTSSDALAADIILITTQDSNIRDADNSLRGRLKDSATVFHTSGSYPSTVLDAAKGTGHDVGSIHPLVSISRPELGPERFSKSFFCIEGGPEALALARGIVQDIGGSPFSIDTRFKTLYHAAAVTACGHLVALFDASVEMMGHAGLEPARAKEILMPLVLSTVDNLRTQDPASALTGTFARADIETFTRHMTTLNENVSEDLLEIYLLLGERSLELAAKQGVSPERIEKLRAKVSIAKSKVKW